MKLEETNHLISKLHNDYMSANEYYRWHLGQSPKHWLNDAIIIDRYKVSNEVFRLVWIYLEDLEC